MIIVMKRNASAAQVGAVVNEVETQGYHAHLSQGTERTIIGVVGDDRPIQAHPFEMLDGVEQVVRILQPFKLASRDFHPDNTIITIPAGGPRISGANGLPNGNGHGANGSQPVLAGLEAAVQVEERPTAVRIGDQKLVIMAGPCAVESRSQIIETAIAVKEAGATVLRGGAFKPRSSPYSFQGLGEAGLELLAEARDATGLPVITEVMSPDAVPIVARYADIMQIGARNMQNFDLLKAAGKTQTPVFVKRGMMNTVQEWLMSAEYVLSGGNYQVMLCERGIRTFETATRNTLDINAIAVLKQLTHLPVFGDPSHATGKWDLVAPAARACIAAGADGLIVEVHPQPDKAMSDGAQSLKPERFAELVASLRSLAPALGRTV